MAKIKQLLLLLCLLTSVLSYSQIMVGAERINSYLPLLQEKKIAIVGNQSSLIQKKHLVDSLLIRNINIIKVFSPEHGFRGIEDIKIEDGIDEKTGIPIISLY